MFSTALVGRASLRHLQSGGKMACGTMMSEDAPHRARQSFIHRGNDLGQCRTIADVACRTRANVWRVNDMT